MSIRPIAWHSTCLVNLTASLERLMTEIKQKQADADLLAADIARLDAQIRAAKLRGMDGFDADRFLKRQGVFAAAKRSDPSDTRAWIDGMKIGRDSRGETVP